MKALSTMVGTDLYWIQASWRGIFAKVWATISIQMHLLQRESQHNAALTSTFARMAQSVCNAPI
jgi:hypothetical protein